MLKEDVDKTKGEFSKAYTGLQFVLGYIQVQVTEIRLLYDMMR